MALVPRLTLLGPAPSIMPSVMPEPIRVWCEELMAGGSGNGCCLRGLERFKFSGGVSLRAQFGGSFEGFVRGAVYYAKGGAK